MSTAALRSTILRNGITRGTSCRSLATIAPNQALNVELNKPSSSKLPPVTTLNWKKTPNGPLRPPVDVEVDPAHGLWAFFRKNEKGDHIALEAPHKSKDFSGRPWEALELRRKSFKDLHTLWYVALRERNLLATQNAELRRVGIPEVVGNNPRKGHRVRKTMSRIKLVLNERRLAYARAVELHNQRTAKEASDSSVPTPEAIAPKA